MEIDENNNDNANDSPIIVSSGSDSESESDNESESESESDSGIDLGIPTGYLGILTNNPRTRQYRQRESKVKTQIKRERVRIDSLETHFNILLPNLLQALKAADSLTKSMVASNIALMNRINKNENKIQLLEDNAGSTDSTNFEILAKLVMIENKIVLLVFFFGKKF